MIEVAAILNLAFKTGIVAFCSRHLLLRRVAILIAIIAISGGLLNAFLSQCQTEAVATVAVFTLVCALELAESRHSIARKKMDT